MTKEGQTERLRRAYAALPLKDEPRTGWVQHGVQDAESVAAHSWGTAYLCLLFAEQAGVDRAKAVEIAVLHDLAEARTGDVAARLDPLDRTVSEAHKSASELAAMEELLPPELGDLHAAWLAYEERSTPEAVFVRDMNLLDMCLQGVKYERDRRYDPTVLIPSQGGHRHLDEFFAGAQARLSTAVAKELYEVVHAWYLQARGRP
ncbi:MAG: HD family hydrolase [Trueperaceae bacterium]